MDPWRIGLLIASAVFFVFLLLRLRPRMPDSSEEEEVETAPSGTEQRLYRRLRKLPEAAQRRILKRLEAALHTSELPTSELPTSESGNGSGDEGVD